MDRALNGIAPGSQNATARQRPDQILPIGYLDKSGRPLTRWLNPLAYALPAMGSYGNVGYNAVVGPRTWSFDMALLRTFNLRESQRIEVRAEAFNVLNSFIPGNPSTNISTPNTFGQIRTALPPRIMQFALKYVF